ncbi:hypothetical protein F5144DRAFT_325767 [Chaetomium tenue]|uniref:Uncharacterized protein n=1 Tax=Chaetomium tenue TaxID=1854479 RepID=A0ACB7P6J7_9PEZI|nr:hypothetical protein F5144DRAFT_325767 [Chaetomium globosum]
MFLATPLNVLLCEVARTHTGGNQPPSTAWSTLVDDRSLGAPLRLKRRWRMASCQAIAIEICMAPGHGTAKTTTGSHIRLHCDRLDGGGRLKQLAARLHNTLLTHRHRRRPRSMSPRYPPFVDSYRISATSSEYSPATCIIPKVVTRSVKVDSICSLMRDRSFFPVSCRVL